jgi:hypothetical protein
LPLIPAGVLKKHCVHEPLDTRFRSAARLLQALWCEDRGLPIGSYINEDGKRRNGALIDAERLDQPGVEQRAVPVVSAGLKPRKFAFRRRDIAAESMVFVSPLPSNSPMNIAGAYVGPGLWPTFRPWDMGFFEIARKTSSTFASAAIVSSPVAP